MKIVSRTHIGKVRSSNQDALLLQDGVHGLYGVADGMGGHRGGDVASQMAVVMLGHVLEGKAPSEACLRAGIEEVNQMIFTEQLHNRELSGMGTTLTVLWEDSDRLLLGHVGDSRAYHIRSGKIRQVSQDHSMVADLVRDGVLTEEQARVHPYRNIITRALGTADTIEVDVLEMERRAGDKFLLCSDGLSEYVRPEEMLEILTKTPTEDAAEEMLQMALDGGGRDNITLLIAEVTA